MTTFGKLIVGIVGLVIGGGIFYGALTYVKRDVTIVPETATTTNESSESPFGTSSGTPIGMPASSSTPELPFTATTSPVAEGKKIPFSTFMQKGGSYKCNVIQTVATMVTNGTVYLGNGKVRAEFSMSIQDQQIETSMIMRDGYTYSWTNKSTTGNKVKHLAGRNEDGSVKTTAYSWNGAQVGDYTCEPWTVIESIFALPSSITFTEI